MKSYQKHQPHIICSGSGDKKTGERDGGGTKSTGPKKPASNR